MFALKHLLLVFMFITAAGVIAVSAQPRCAASAKSDALKLLKFHSNDDERAELDPDITARPSLANPANKKQKFDVVEVWGYVYKGQYRMRLIYYYLNSECVLLGQEILEHAAL